MGSDWKEQWIVVDGHNVQITMESAALGRPVLMANDSVLRDVAGESARFRMSEVTRIAIDLVFRFLETHRPRRISFLFDSPMSHSGDLANEYRRRLMELHIDGEARALPVPEREIPYEECTVASSDGAILEKSTRWLDLACVALSYAGRLRLAVDFSKILGVGAENQVRTCEWELDCLEEVQESGTIDL